MFDQRLPAVLAGSTVFGVAAVLGWLVGAGWLLEAALGVVALGAAVTTVLQPGLVAGVLVAALIGQVPDVLARVHGVRDVDLLIAGLMLVICLGRAAAAQRVVLSITRTQLLLVTLASVSAVATLLANDVTIATDRFSGLLRELLLLAVAAGTVAVSRALRWSVWAAVIIGALLAALALYQGLTGQFSQHFFGLAQASSGHIAGEVDRLRVSGPFADPNAFGQYLLVFAVLALFRAWDERQPGLRLAAGVAAVLCLGAMLNTFSRGTLVALGLVLVLVFRLRRVSLRLLLAGAVLVLPAVLAAPAGLDQRLGTLAGLVAGGDDLVVYEGSFRGRLSESWAGLRMALDHPWFGVGPGNAALVYQAYAWETGLEFRREERSIPNLFLERWAESGLLGLGAFVAVLASAAADLRRAARLYRQQGDVTGSSIAESLLVALAAFVAAGLFLPFAYERGFWMLVALAIAAEHVATADQHRLGYTARAEHDAISPVKQCQSLTRSGATDARV